jgi:hypothetical protein|tara:strand:- start:8323 stop:8517 length:195 start_codon:yes stop_codon:yes gene_type:complete
MPHYSYIIGDYYYYKEELLAAIEEVETDRRLRLNKEMKIFNTPNVYLSTTFKEDLIKKLNERLV